MQKEGFLPQDRQRHPDSTTSGIAIGLLRRRAATHRAAIRRPQGQPFLFLLCLFNFCFLIFDLTALFT